MHNSPGSGSVCKHAHAHCTGGFLSCLHFDVFGCENDVFERIGTSPDVSLDKASEVHFFSHVYTLEVYSTFIRKSFTPLPGCLRCSPPLRENSSVRVTSSAGFFSCSPSSLGEAAWRTRSWRRRTRIPGCCHTWATGSCCCCCRC